MKNHQFHDRAAHGAHPAGPAFVGGRFRGTGHGGGHDHGAPGFGPGGWGAPRMWGPEMGFGPRRGFGPGGRARKGDVRAAILTLLGENPDSGYGLIKAIAARSEGAWRPSPGSVYPTLQQLVDEELIEQVGSDGGRSPYTLTDAGRAYVTEHADELARAFDLGESARAANEELAQLRDSIGKLMGVVGQVASAGTPAQRTAAVEKLDALRRELYGLLAE